MSDQFVGEIRVGAWNFAPKNFAFCNGQLLPISQNTALFSLLGTFYGGDGKSTFALPNLQGRAPVSAGDTPFGSSYFLGGEYGTSTVTLLESEMPAHTHIPQVSPDAADLGAPATDRVLASAAAPFTYQTNTTSQLATMAFQTASVAGGSFPHNNMPPALVLNFVIALVGIFPARP
jgi:microcystin-dependent protein